MSKGLVKFWSSTGWGLPVSECFFDEDANEFLVRVTKYGIMKEERFKPALYPRYGMDLIDDQKSEEIAKRLSEDFACQICQ